MNFIPANESRFFIWFFNLVTRFLLWRRFRKVWLKQDYHPDPHSRTVYFMNHNLWWDGLLPLYLNRKFFRQQARALMEGKQMKEHPFFARIGAFSVNLESPRSAIQSLRYAVSSMERPSSCLFIYPEGELQPASEKKPEFKEGLAWLYEQLPEVDFVPICFYTHNFKGSKPELYIRIGEACKPQPSLNRAERKGFFEDKLHELLAETRAVAGKTDEGFHPC